MKYLIAPDSYKESMSAIRAAKAIEKGIKRMDPNSQCELVPMADGGEGTAECLTYDQGGEQIDCIVTNPLGEPIKSDFIWVEQTKTAVIEVAKACGLMLISPADKNPNIATTYGVGELILEALKKQCKEIILTLGGTVTNDGGTGMLAALGAELLDAEGEPITPGGCSLGDIEAIDLSKPIRLLKGIHIKVLCDVKNPLLGENGATYIFAPQKGATAKDLPVLEQAMANYADKINQAAGRDLAAMPGAGAAGGLGCALFAISDAQFCSGSEYVMKSLGLEEKILKCDYVITGEGAIDSQSLQGKVPVGIASVAKKYNKPVVVFAGKVEGSMDAFYDHGITAVFCILRGLKPLEQVLKEAEYNLQMTVENVTRILVAPKV